MYTNGFGGINIKFLVKRLKLLAVTGMQEISNKARDVLLNVLIFVIVYKCLFFVVVTKMKQLMYG